MNTKEKAAEMYGKQINRRILFKMNCNIIRTTGEKHYGYAKKEQFVC